MPKYLYPYILSYDGKILYIGFAMVLNQVGQYYEYHSIENWFVKREQKIQLMYM